MSKTENPALIKPNHVNKKSTELGQSKATHLWFTDVARCILSRMSTSATAIEQFRSSLYAVHQSVWVFSAFSSVSWLNMQNTELTEYRRAPLIF